MPPDPGWLIDGADLLAEPDPGPTPWLVDRLIVDQALVAAVGRWKTTKSYGLLEVCIAVATGRPAFGALAVPEPGPVVYVNEESGRVALQRRLDALCRGRAIPREELRGRLHLGANARLKLDDPDWQAELVAIGQRLRPRLFVFDPLARMKNAARDENAQTDMAVVIEYLRALRSDTGAAVCFVHHTGHQGERMRGSSDLESAWETRLTWKRDGQASEVDVESEHREAESGPTVRYRLNWDGDTRTMRLDHVADERTASAYERVVAYLAEHPGASGKDVETGIGGNADLVRTVLRQLVQAGTSSLCSAEKLDAQGRTRRYKGYFLNQQAASLLVQNGETSKDEDAPRTIARPSPLFLRGDEQSRTSNPDDQADAEQASLKALLREHDEALRGRR